MKKSFIVIVGLFFIQQSWAQEYSKVVGVGVPFLMVAADARSAGMADQGVATSADAFSQQYNPAKYAFSLDKQGFSILSGLARRSQGLRRVQPPRGAEACSATPP